MDDPRNWADLQFRLPKARMIRELRKEACRTDTENFRSGKLGGILSVENNKSGKSRYSSTRIDFPEWEAFIDLAPIDSKEKESMKVTIRWFL